MAFFNYSTMQMTAKIVYYGPGLGGKTTNLEFIHHHTTEESRGEMVSLETQSDRTLFFDLLPLNVGTVAGFHTRIQLYTVPGQVFYNTTRKLVLKGVDGVVFVGDSQRPMLDANLESLANLGRNLEDLGLSLDAIPLVLQYNKRDLPEICSVEELERQLNPRGWPSFEASALHGRGVIETLRAISKSTLLSLKRQLETGSGPAAVARPPAPPAVERRGRPAPPTAVAVGNGRQLRVRLPRRELERARTLRLAVEVRGEGEELLHEIRDLQCEIAPPTARRGRRVRLDIALDAED